MLREKGAVETKCGEVQCCMEELPMDVNRISVRHIPCFMKAGQQPLLRKFQCFIDAVQDIHFFFVLRVVLVNGRGEGEVIQRYVDAVTSVLRYLKAAEA
jgi:hypothetical protein